MKTSNLSRLALAGAFAGVAALTGCNNTSGGGDDATFASASTLAEFQEACVNAEGSYSTAASNSCEGYAFVNGAAEQHDCAAMATAGFEANCMVAP
jgi:hypothetical protein